MTQYFVTRNIQQSAQSKNSQDFSQNSFFLKSIDYFMFEDTLLDFSYKSYIYLLILDHLIDLYFFLCKYFDFFEIKFVPSCDFIHDYTYSRYNGFFRNYVNIDDLPPAVQNGLCNTALFNVISFFEISFVVLLLIIGLSCYLSFYYDTYGESFLDFDYLFSTSIVLSEKELGAVEDMLEFFSIIVFLFGWFFYVYGWSFFLTFNELSLVLLFAPLAWYALIFIPFCLIIDFSLMFASYLRGVSTTSSFFVESMFDYIAGFAYLLRTFVQNVRYTIMLFVCFGVYEIVILVQTPDIIHLLWHNQSILEIASKCRSSEQNYALIILSLNVVVSYAYELVHTFFVLGVQLTSFVVMVFWLFSFLYTYFAIELLEKFFYELRYKFFKKNS